MSRYKLAARWHAYRARSEGVPMPATPWTGPAPEPHPGLLPPQLPAGLVLLPDVDALVSA